MWYWKVTSSFFLRWCQMLFWDSSAVQCENLYTSWRCSLRECLHCQRKREYMLICCRHSILSPGAVCTCINYISWYYTKQLHNKNYTWLHNYYCRYNQILPYNSHHPSYLYILEEELLTTSYFRWGYSSTCVVWRSSKSSTIKMMKSVNIIMILRHHISTQWQGCGLAATNRLLKIIEVLPFLLDRKCGENNSVIIAVSLLQSLMVYQAHSLHSVSVHAAIISLKRNFWSHYLTVTCFSAHLVIGVANGKKPLLN